MSFFFRHVTPFIGCKNNHCYKTCSKPITIAICETKKNNAQNVAVRTKNEDTHIRSGISNKSINGVCRYVVVLNPYAHVVIFVTLAYTWDKYHYILSLIIFLSKYALKTNLLQYIVKCISSRLFMWGKSGCLYLFTNFQQLL